MVFVVVVVVGNQEQNAVHFRVLTNAVDGMWYTSDPWAWLIIKYVYKLTAWQ